MASSVYAKNGIDVSKISSNSTKSLIAGEYTYQSSVNFDNYLKEMGLSYILRQMAAVARPVITIHPAERCKQVEQEAYFSSSLGNKGTQIESSTIRITSHPNSNYDYDMNLIPMTIAIDDPNFNLILIYF